VVLAFNDRQAVRTPRAWTLLIESPTVHEDFDYPRSARIYRVTGGFSLDKLAEAISREWDEHDFDVESVLIPEAFDAPPPLHRDPELATLAPACVR
jgi:hypothetical protein